MRASAVEWPPALSGTPAVNVIERAIAHDRLSHSLLLQGDDPEALGAVAQAIADRLLHPAGGPPASGARFAPDHHPDCFVVRPTGKTRIITAEATRDLINQLQVSPAVAAHKVAIIHEADRMNTAAANIFLKTLEEPPGHTTLLLLTTRPYTLLPTIRSRVLHFRFPSAGSALAIDGWTAWLDDYRAWLERLGAGTPDKRAVADHIFTLYGLIARFAAVLAAAVSEAWKRQKELLPPDLADDEETAFEMGLANGLRARLFAEIEQSTRTFAIGAFREDAEEPRRAATRNLAAAVSRLERAAGLLRLNLNENAALEDFLLASLRIWSRR